MAGNDETDERCVDLRPSPVLAVGITGHRNVAQHDHTAQSVAATLDELLDTLTRSFRKAISEDSAFFSNSKPVLRVTGMLAEGADLMGAQAARDSGAEISCILPFAFEEYQKDFSCPATQELARLIFAEADARFILPGNREEGPRAYERANVVILANIDLLIAVWDGARATGRAGTGDVVQAAVSRDIPVIVIEPKVPFAATLLFVRSEETLENLIATDLPRKPLDSDLSALISQIMAPPVGSTKRQGLVDLVAEKSKARSFRVEYSLLLKLFRVVRVRMAAATQPASGTKVWRDAATLGEAMSRESATQLIKLERQTSRIDVLAGHYGLLYRSSSTSAFLLIIVAATISATALIVFPSISAVSIIAQFIVNGLVLIDALIRNKQRWQERWLDYRLIVERLRCLRFLRPLGLGLDQTSNFLRHDRGSWVEWYIRRSDRQLGAPVGEMQAADMARGAQQIADLHIREQLRYHRTTFRQIGLLEMRLSLAASLALGSTFFVAAVFGVLAYLNGGTGAITWKPIAVLLLFVLPATATAFNGVRADADLVRLAERSAMTATALAKLRRIVSSTTMNYDRLAASAIRAAVIMGGELSEWRFVLESRRSRTRRSRSLGRSRLFHLR
jgi:hypothetical protein